MATEMRCWKCDVQYWITDTLYARRKEDKESFYCPNGHGAIFSESTADKLRRELARANQQIARAEDEAREVAAQRDREIKARKRIEKRINAGVCPCCSRHFTNLERHMKSQHADGKVVPLKVKA